VLRRRRPLAPLRRVTESLDSAEAELGPPGAVFTSQRWYPQATIEWVRQADQILLEHGAVAGQVLVEHRHQARHRAQRLIRLMVELRLHERWELSEHTERSQGGWIWSVLRRRDDTPED